MAKCRANAFGLLFYSEGGGSDLTLLLLLLLLLTYSLQLGCHPVTVVLTLLQTKQISKNKHKRNNTKTQYKQYKTQQVQVHILPKHPHIHSPEHYKTS